MINLISKKSAGYTLPEIIVVIFIVLLLFNATWTFYSSITNTNNSLAGSLDAQTETRKTFSTMTGWIRSASPSSLGSYTIAAASSTAFIFYSDIDSDGLKERIRYFVSGNILKLGIIKPSGSPLITYNPANEKISAAIHGLVNEPGDPVLSYYSWDYDGTNAPLSSPVNILNIRLVKIKVLIDNDPLKPPAVMEFTTQVSIRNLKDNL